MRLSNRLPNQIIQASISFLLLLTLYIELHVNALEKQTTAKISVYYPKGFKVSIPDEPGIKLFGFHGKINGPKGATWAQNIIRARNGRWTFRDEKTQFKINDTLNYSIRIYHNDTAYTGDDGIYVVRGYTDPTTPEDNGNGVGMSDICTPSVTIMNGGKSVACSGQIIFEDDFSGSQLDTQKWKLERRFPTEPDYEFVMYLDDVPDLVTLWNGVVTIAPKTTESYIQSTIKPVKNNMGIRCTGSLETEECDRSPITSPDIIPPFISAQFSTKNRFSFKYGRIEIRAKLPCIEWSFPQLWLQPVATTYGVNNYESGQMRIAFSQVNATGLQLFGGVILNVKEPWRTLQMCHVPLVTDWCNDFHVYQLTWTDNLIGVAVDDNEKCRFTSADAPRKLRTATGAALPNVNKLEEGTAFAPFDQEFYVTLGYGIGGHYDFKDDTKEWKNPKPWTNTDPRVMKKFWKSVKNNINQWLGRDDLRVDYVRVYAA